MNAHRPYLIDTTLRDGEQKAGFVIREADKPAIAAMLDRIGVDEIEIGIPAMGDMIRQTIRAIDELPLTCRRTVWCRAKAVDIDHAASCHNGAVHLSLPASSRLRSLYGISESDVLALAHEMIGQARDRFGFISAGVQDAARSEQAFLRELTAACHEAGADRLRLADTVGVWTPQRAGACFADLKPYAGAMELAIHAHNDLGMATANTLAALDAGAVAADVTILGIGERAGNAALEQVVTAGRLTGGYFEHIDLAQLTSLCQAFADLTGITVPDSQPVVGKGVVRHESGIHVHALLKDPSSYQPFDPATVGHDGPSYVLGKHSGLAALRHLLGDAGQIHDSDLVDLLNQVREHANYGEAVTDFISKRRVAGG